MLKVYFSNSKIHITNKEEGDKILSSHRWEKVITGNQEYDTYKCKCDVEYDIDEKKGHSRIILGHMMSLICKYSVEDHMVIDVIC